MKTLNRYTKNDYTFDMIKLDKPIFGGMYCVELRHKDNLIKKIDGLCLDTANELYLNIIKQIKN